MDVSSEKVIWPVRTPLQWKWGNVPSMSDAVRESGKKLCVECSFRMSRVQFSSSLSTQDTPASTQHTRRRSLFSAPRPAFTSLSLPRTVSYPVASTTRSVKSTITDLLSSLQPRLSSTSTPPLHSTQLPPAFPSLSNDATRIFYQQERETIALRMVRDGDLYRIAETDFEALVSVIMAPMSLQRNLIHQLSYRALYMNALDMKRLTRLTRIPGPVGMQSLRLERCTFEQDTLRGLFHGMAVGALAGAGVLTLKELALPGVSLSRRDVAALAKLLSNGVLQLSSLVLSDCDLGPSGVSSITSALMQHPTLCVLDISGNGAEAVGAKSIAKMLRKHTTRKLTHLYLGRNSLHAAGICRIAEALKLNSTLTHLALDLNEMGTEGARVLATALAMNTALTHVQLCRNTIGDQGVAFLVDALTTPSCRLKWLDLECNSIGPVGAQHLARLLGVCRDRTGLYGLKLVQNRIGDVGTMALAQQLANRTRSLTHLDLKDNGLTTNCAPALAHMLTHNRTLKYLSIKDNPQLVLNDDPPLASLTRIMACIRRYNLTLKTLEFGPCPLSMPQDEMDQWAQLYGQCDYALARNVLYEPERRAHVLWTICVGRMLLYAKKSTSTWRLLPTEVREHILLSVDGHMLHADERSRLLQWIRTWQFNKDKSDVLWHVLNWYNVNLHCIQYPFMYPAYP